MGMKQKSRALGLAIGLALGALALGTVASAQPPGDSGEVKRISAADAKAAVEKGTAVLIDVRAKVAFDAEHAKGALSIPLAEVTTRLAEIPIDKLIVAYCT